jgi:hypothetical protein
MPNKYNDIVSIAWNGVDELFQFIQFDEEPLFSILMFNYSGNHELPELSGNVIYHQMISVRTEFKGEILDVLGRNLSDIEYEYLGILDDDQEISISGINKMLATARAIDADIFQPSITKDSYYSHKRFLNNGTNRPEAVDWLEIMSPFLKKQLFEAGLPFYKQNISSYGIDMFLYPYLQRKLGMNRAFLMHETTLKHNRPVTDGSRRFSNGLDARQEGELLRSQVLKKIQEEKIEFSPEELRDIYGVGKIRWDVIKYNIKRKLCSPFMLE